MKSRNNDNPKFARLGVRRLTESAMIAALYAAATLVLAPISYGPLQLRVSEALTLLPVFTPAATIGLAIGCAIANGIGVLLGTNLCGLADVLFGTVATLLAAMLSRLLRRVELGGLPVLSALPPVLFNALIVGGELAVVYKLPYWLCALQVAGGELLVTLLLGLPLVAAIRKLRIFDSPQGLS